MKKFKTPKHLTKIRVIILIVLFLILFIIVSFWKFHNPYQKVTNVLLNDFNEDKDLIRLSFLTSNLDHLLNNYAFFNDKITYQKTPVIYLYNTHDNEKYADNKNIYEATRLLKNNLNKLGISVIQEERKTSDFHITGLSYYDISRTFIKDVMEKENISYYIDIHRDSVNDTKVTINNKSYAKILFVLGLENKDYLKNKSILLKMNDYLNTNYPGISRGIYEKKGSGVDGIYNQDLASDVLLIEIGGVENNLEEVANSTEILSLMLYHMLGD